MWYKNVGTDFFVLSQFTRLTDRRTRGRIDRQTDRHFARG